MGNGEIAVQENHQPLTIIEQTDPAVIIEDATYIANQLADIIKQKKLYKKIGNKDHVYVEGWTTLGALSKIFPVLQYSERLGREDEIAYESRVVAQTIEGKVVGVGEAICSNKENNWRGRDEYAIKSMSQTRATSKALRMPLGWIMVLAGYNPTPAEEMDGTNKFPNQGVVNSSKKPAPTSGRKPAPAKKPAPARASDEEAVGDIVDADYKIKTKTDDEPEQEQEVQETEEETEDTNEEGEKKPATELLDSTDDLTKEELKEMSAEEIGLWATGKLRAEDLDITGAEIGRVLMGYNRKRWLSTRKLNQVKAWFMDKYMTG